MNIVSETIRFQLRAHEDHQHQEGQGHAAGPHQYPLFCPFECDSHCIDNSLFIDYGLAIFLCSLCITVSLWHIGKHLKYFTNPHFQAKIIIILCMAPFYCLSSILSISFHTFAKYLMVVRDCYEAFLLFTFFYLIFGYLAYDEEKDEINDQKLYTIMSVPDEGNGVKQVHHMWPFNYCFRAYKLSSEGKAKYFTYRKYNGGKIIIGIENTLICFEMLAMAILGGPAFSFHDFKNAGFVQRGKFKDVLFDLFDTFKHDFRLIKPKKFGKKKEHEEQELKERLQRLSQTSLVGEFRIEMYDDNNEDKKFSYHPELVRESTPDQQNEVKVKHKYPKTDLTQLLIPDNH